ncbi:glycosyltransferase family 2 protein [Winogradskyella haliclonae]|uniref:Glycosyltransferase 2-like domain-containing protein n=1 Tax=Winogradskyella haliclonae TaxID=2048558 RepID=A0ABQ2BZW2_9FLAO|nr:glycosyltransferase family 2 protein [Winogradskyella haliclonae]GGI58041.1 hypothetical protein GCM10011444_23500 [Winogradskyella haliclonae]
MLENVYIVIATYNGEKWIKTCLQSCKGYTVIVVDNNSTDATVSLIKQNFPEVILIEESNNHGFGKANNIGIRFALDKGASHVFLLNQDAYLCDDVLEVLVKLQSKSPEYGILSPIHLSSEKRGIDAKFMDYVSYKNCANLHSDLFLNKPLKAIYDVAFVNAAAWLISRSCLETVGGFDPLFYHYGEDDNYCQRLSYHGYKLGMVPNTYIIHDRENIDHHKVEKFSEAYFKNKLKGYKIDFANVNRVDTLLRIEAQKKLLQKTILKMMVFLKLSKAHNWLRELRELKNIEQDIFSSIKKNKTKGTHYL